MLFFSLSVSDREAMVEWNIINWTLLSDHKFWDAVPRAWRENNGYLARNHAEAKGVCLSSHSLLFLTEQ